MSPGPEKRIPGQGNAEYDRRRDPNADFLGLQAFSVGRASLDSLTYRAVRAFRSWIDRRRGRGQ